MSKVEDRYNDSREAPLYKATEVLLYKVDDIMHYLQRDRRHTLGQHMLNIVLGMLDCISLAYDFPEQRAEQLQLYITRYNNLATILKMCEQKGYLCHGKKNMYVDMIHPLGVAQRQAKGWLNATMNARVGGNKTTTERALD